MTNEPTQNDQNKAEGFEIIEFTDYKETINFIIEITCSDSCLFSCCQVLSYEWRA